MKHKPAHVSSLQLACICALGACAAPALAAGPAGVKLDGTLGGGAAVLTGPVYNITQSLGRLAGGNLFFSFQYFNIATNELALFSTTSAGINNVISRVTGGYSSTIDGEIALVAASGAPNFYFINPAGVTFTANAIVDVPAAFAVTTANYLKFSDGNFYSDPSKTSTLSAMAPEAFGFLGTTRAPVNVDGAGLLAGVGGNGEFQVVAGDVTIDGGGQFAAIETASADVRVIATGAQSAEVPLSGTFKSTDGTVTLEAGGEIGAFGGAGDAAGGLYVSAGTLLIDATDGAATRSGLFSSAGADGAGPIRIDVGGSATLTNGAYIASQTSTAGTGASITVNAGALTIQGANASNNSQLTSITVGAGAAGAINLNVSGPVNIQNGGLIAAETFGVGNAGAIAVSAQSLNIDGGTSPYVTGIDRQANDSGTSTGQVSVTISGPITMANYGLISSDTFSAGDAGDVNVTAQSLSITSFAEISSSAGQSAGNPGSSTGNAGQVSITTSGATTLTNGGYIAANSFTTGNAGNVIVNAASLSIESSPTIETTGIFSNAFGLSGNAGQVTVSTGSLAIENGFIDTQIESTGGAGGRVSVAVSGAATIGGGGYISTDSFSSSNAGNIVVTAGSLAVDGTNSSILTGISSSGYGSGNAGQVSVTTSGATTVANGAEIASSAFAAGSAGSVALNVGSLDVDGGAGTSRYVTGVLSGTNALNSGSAGQVVVTSAGAVSILNGAEISATTSSAASAGSVTVNAASLRIDGGSSPAFTGIASSTQPESSGNAGEVTVTTSGATTLAGGAQISTTTFGAGNAGDVILDVGGLSVTGSATTGLTGVLSSADGRATGNAGRVTVASSGDIALTGGGSVESQTSGKGNAGQVSVTSASTVSLNGGLINSNTSAAGNAGDVSVTAGALSLDGKSGATAITSSAEPGSSGNAGQVSVTTSGATTIVDGAQILSVTFGAGNAGDLTLKAGSLTVENGTTGDYSAISTTAAQGSNGSAGSVTVDVSGTATLTDYGFISSAAHGTAGQPGTVAISAGTLIVGDHGLISIENSSTVADPTRITPTQIDLRAGTIDMNDGQITAASTGNIAASSIDISFLQTLHLDPSSITTTSYQGNGGPITITGDGFLWLQNSSITTSVLGTTNGNGGDIRITVPYIVLDSGVIQANTTAPNASGGDVFISADALVPSFESYVLGGSIVSFNSATLGQNVVQAAAPDGVSGTLDVTVPSLDLGNALLGLTGTPSTPIALSRSLCTYRRGSSLSIAGRGGLPVSYRDPLWIDLEEGDSGEAAGAAPTADRSVSEPPDREFSVIACR